MIRTTAYTFPNSRHKFLCLADIIDEAGEFFTSKRAYVVQGDRIKKITVAKHMLGEKIDLTYRMNEKFNNLQTRGRTPLNMGPFIDIK